MGAARYMPYPAYKPSGVEWSEEFPEEWVATRFKNLFTIKKRIAGKIGPDVLSITQKGIKVKDLESGEGQLASDYSKYQHVYAGDFAMNHMDLLTGYVDISKYDGVTSPDYRVFSLDRDDCHPAFYLYILQHCYHAKIFFPLGQGAAHLGRWRLPAEAFNTFVAPVPSLPEQTKIAAFLDFETGQIDALIAKQQRLIELLEEKRQAVISHAVTKGLDPTAPLRPSGIDWLGDVPEHWEVKKFSHCTSIRSGQVDPRKLPYSEYTLIAPNHIESGTGRILSMETATEQGADSGKYLCAAGEVIYSKIRPALAKACLAPHDETICSADMYPISGAEGLSNKFLFWNLLSQWFTSLTILESDRVAMPKINREKLAEVSLPVPPIDEQGHICDFIEKQTSILDTLVTKAKSAIALLKERRTALISAAVTGKIDVRDWQPPQPISDTDSSTKTLQEAAI